MRSVYISLPSVKTVQNFVAQISKLEGNFDIREGVYVLDARSLMGILSLNLKEPIQLIIEKDTKETMKVINKFKTDTKTKSKSVKKAMPQSTKQESKKQENANVLI